ncbi:glycosyltransferase [Oleiharenicola lentus]|uniref:Glycosyltransferase n=2 Tax=Oleiharenicola lentus TaxID=2508720 RepID=A0A4V1M616_9BACT|nr:glycosyltransferase [Oleiharenicola lentus]
MATATLRCPMPAPLISVIIVCRNPGPALRTALGSVWQQEAGDHEVVVVDGASTDGTREWLAEQSARLGAWVSEPDGGVYDAMNKAFRLAQGEWVLFLGADDRLADRGVLTAVKPDLKNPTAGVVVGEAAYDDGRVYRSGATGSAVQRNFVHHQAAFYRRTLFEKHGGFDATLPTRADYDFNLRLMQAGTVFQSVRARIAVCGSGGLSDSGRWSGYREEITVRHRHFPAWRCWLWDAGSGVRYLRKKIVRSFASTRPE